jgi:hypothetical protein
MSVTVWNTNTNAIATRREITGWTTPEGDASPEPIYSDPVPLERLTAAIWTRPRWNATMRADPASYGANNFNAGERILTVIDVRPTLGEYDRLGAMGAGVPDLDAGTMTYTWAKISRHRSIRRRITLRCGRAARGLSRSRSRLRCSSRRKPPPSPPDAGKSRPAASCSMVR